MASTSQPESAPDVHDDSDAVDRPEDWGWHGEFGKTTAFLGWFTAIVLVLMMTSTHYNGQGTLFLGLSAAVIVAGLLYERRRRRNAWRK